MIRYAGYDPNENDFSEFNGKTPLRHERHRRRGMIDVLRAMELKAKGLTWDAIADQLTFEAGRAIRFCGQSVYKAARNARH